MQDRIPARVGLPARTLFVALGFAALAAMANTAQAQAKLVPAGSELGFTFRQMGVPVDGHFKRFDAQLAFDPKKPEAGKVSFSIELPSVGLGAPEVETELAKPLWFDSKKTAQASFQSSAIKSAGKGRLDVSGKLSIKGQSRDITVPVTLTQSGAQTTASGSFTIKRLDYRIGEGEWSDTSIVANDVQVKFKLNFSGIGPL
jgi:polyisoprenoid-binding protein YceI